jgi:hypothetical protein
MDVDPKELLQALSRTANPFAFTQPNPSLVLDTQNSWGRTEIVRGPKLEQLVRVQLPVMAFVGLTARAIEFDNGTNLTQLRPYARIRYGHGSVLAESLIDITGGWTEVVLGSTFELDVFLADADGFPPDAGSDASAKIQGWGSVGVTPYPQRNTKFTSSSDPATALVFGCMADDVVVGSQGRILNIEGFVLGADPVPSYLLFFDSYIAPGDPDFGDPDILYVVPIPAATMVTFDKDFSNTKAFVNGVSYGLSSSPTQYIAASATTLSVTVETLT